jgi:hypothetical protein
MRQGVLHYISRTPHKICKHGDGLGSTVYILCPSDGLMDPAESQTRTHSETKSSPGNSFQLVCGRYLVTECLTTHSLVAASLGDIGSCPQSFPLVITIRKFPSQRPEKYMSGFVKPSSGCRAYLPAQFVQGHGCPPTKPRSVQFQNVRLCLVQHMRCAASLLSADQRIVSISGGVSLPSNLHLPCPYLREVVKRCLWYDRPTLHIVARTRSCLSLFANPKAITFLIPSGKSLPCGNQIHL